MPKYAVQAKIKFTGVTEVEAENAHEACRIAENEVLIADWCSITRPDVDVLDIDEEKEWVKVSK